MTKKMPKEERIRKVSFRGWDSFIFFKYNEVHLVKYFYDDNDAFDFAIKESKKYKYSTYSIADEYYRDNVFMEERTREKDTREGK